MRKLVVLLCLVSFILCGCASEKALQQHLNSLVGISEVQLTTKYGIPDKVYQLGNTKYVSYAFSSSYYVPQSQSSDIYGYGNYATINTQNYGGYTINRSCVITFIVENSRVINWRYQGNDCRL